MMKKRIMKLTSMVFLALCMAFAANSGAMAGDMSHDAHQNMNQSGMAMTGGQEIMLGEDVQDIVQAAAHLRDIREAMEKMGMDKTHHFMVMFKDVSSGKTLDQGLVALKVVDPSGKKSDAVKLMGMGEGFGGDVSLSQKGKYILEVGTKLADGKTRQFRFNYIVE